jgi:alkanesulfonate monooxygenase SsuD/methylene tetrahydromethanopterin reductase-like flavin-dependent oxidoreductase (luciferase family)
MRFGLTVPNFGDLSDPVLMVELATQAEAVGWDGFFVWDHIVVADGMAVADPWVQLAAVGQATDHIVIGPLVTPLPRRRPWVVARQAETLNRLSGGRLVLGVGIGFPPQEEFGTFGEPTDPRTRAEMLDEGLEVLAGMWSGVPFSFEGAHMRVEETTFAPVPRPAIPVWVAGTWPNRAPFRRAARHDGVFPLAADMSTPTPATLSEIVAYLRQHRPVDDSFEVVVMLSPDSDVDAYRDAGATWSLVPPSTGMTPSALRTMIAGGPPRRGGTV